MVSNLKRFIKRVFRFSYRVIRYFCKIALTIIHILNPRKVYAKWHRWWYLERLIQNNSLVTSEQKYDLISEYNRKFDASGKEYSIRYHKTVALNDILLAQLSNYNGIDFRFADLAARVIAIDDYMNGSLEGMDLYTEMQYKHGAEFDWGERFKKTLKSLEALGFDLSQAIQLDNKLAVLDGMHRLSYAVYKRMPLITVEIFDRVSSRVFDKVWFWEHGFSKDYCLRIENTLQRIIEQARYQFYGIIWPSAMNVANEILEDINHMNATELKLISYHDLTMSKDEFCYFFKQLYRYDCMAEAGMQPKINLILHSAKYQEGERLTLRVFCISIAQPEIVLNTKNGMPKSNAIAKYKKAIRERYKDKVFDYKYDTIIHITDNYLQSKSLEEFIDFNYDLTELFESLSGCLYAVLKDKSPHQHPDFPSKFYLHSDIDFLVSSDDFIKVKDIILSFCEKRFLISKGYTIKQTVVSKEVSHYWIDVKLFEESVCLFDIITTISEVSNDFISEALENGINRGNFNSLAPCFDYVIRICELIEHPEKTWHFEYLNENVEILNEFDLLRYFREPYIDTVTKIIYRVNKNKGVRKNIH